MRLSQDQTQVQRLELQQRMVVMLMMQILHATTLDLERLVTTELEKNPALEYADDNPLADGERQPTESVEESAPAEPGRTEEEIIPTEPGEEYSLGELLPDDSYLPSAGATAERDDDVSGVELAAGPEASLADRLLPQLRSILGEEDAGTAQYIIESLDDDGFLTMEPAEIAEVCGTTLDRVMAILHVIQRLEPGGIACRDRRESFIVQLELAGYGPDSLERRLLADYWELVTRKGTARIAQLCGVTEDEVRAAIKVIVGLEPRPARRFAAGATEYVSPDFSVEWQGDELVVIANDDRIPRLRLSRQYREILLDPKSYSREQVAFAREKLARAKLFLEAIESRRRTLRRLVQLVVDEQREFFLHGPEHLRPATLRQAARVLGVNPSTMSRAVAGKYVETPHGIFSLSYFFKAGTGQRSRTSIKERVQAIVNAEDKTRPLTDEEIAARLKEEGISVSRRTVAKYRGELGIAGCSERKAF